MVDLNGPVGRTLYVLIIIKQNTFYTQIVDKICIYLPCLKLLLQFLQELGQL